jgi:polysaccharide biosynthesis/export protein
MHIRAVRSLLLLPGMLALLCFLSVSASAEEPQEATARSSTGVMSPTIDGQANLMPQRRYQIRKGDVVHVTVFQEPELEITSRVNDSGGLSCPLIGTVKLAGLTSEEAVTVIEAAYRDGYLTKPHVSVMITQHSPQTITVLGQVLRPGAYELPPEGSISILQALGMAGGCTRLASTSRVIVKRHTAKGPELHKLDVKSMASGKEAKLFEIREGDVITVPEKLF